jgi:predicted Zn-dependent peptidase
MSQNNPQIHQQQLDNGLSIVAQQIDSVRSLAMTLLLPAGVAQERPGQQGCATLLAEMICRGAGDLDARQHCDALDQLGVMRGTGVETSHLRIGSNMLADRLDEALPLLLDMVRKPQLADDALPPSKDLALQAIDGLEDEPSQKVFNELRQMHFPEPFGRSPMGQREHLESITSDDIRQCWQDNFVPRGAIISFAGRFDWPHLLELIKRYLGNWQGTGKHPQAQGQPVRGYLHQKAPSTQCHIGLAYDALPENHEQSILQRIATSVLSGGMSSRLFTHVREERGLCYAVSASYGATKDRGAILSYAGTTMPRAQETLDVLVAELHRLSEGVDENEFNRALIGMKSALVMQGESTGARAAAIAGDQYIYGRPRTLDELIELIDTVTLDQINQFVADNPPGPMTIVTVGPEPLEIQPKETQALETQ